MADGNNPQPTVLVFGASCLTCRKAAAVEVSRALHPVAKLNAALGLRALAEQRPEDADGVATFVREHAALEHDVAPLTGESEPDKKHLS